MLWNAYYTWLIIILHRRWKWDCFACNFRWCQFRISSQMMRQHLQLQQCFALTSDVAQGKLQGVGAGFLQISSILPMQNQGVLLGVHRCYCHEAVMPVVKQSCDRSIWPHKKIQKKYKNRAVTSQSVLTNIQYGEHIQSWSSFPGTHRWSNFKHERWRWWLPSGVEYEGGVSHGLEWIRHASHALQL